MTHRFLISVATAALIAGTGFANAQGTGMGNESPSAGSTQSAPSSERGAPSSATPMNRHDASESKGSDSGMKSTQSNDKMAPARNQSAQDSAPGQKSKSMSSENNDTKAGDTKAGKDMKADSRTGTSNTNAADSKTGATDKNMNAQTKPATDSKGMNAESKSATDNKSGSANSQTTTGNAATSATAAPPAEKRTQIVSAIKTERVEEVTNVNFNVSIGTAIPGSVHFHPLPPRIVEIYPEWRGYEFILVRGKYVIVRPQTREIVYIIES